MATPPKKNRVSLRDIARELGVSHVTVSLAMRGDQRISKARREEVSQVAERLGYQPDPMLASLAAYRQSKTTVEISSTIAWFNQWERPQELRAHKEFDAYWNGAKEYAERLGYRLEEFRISPDMSGKRLQQILVTRGVVGILLPPHSEGLDLGEFDWSKFAVVRFGSSIVNPHSHMVTSDQSLCTAMAYERIWDYGYRKIGYITSQGFEVRTGGNFRGGYLAAQDVRLPMDQHLPPLVLSGEESGRDGERLQRWLGEFSPDAALTTCEDLDARLKEVGISVPQDLAVAATSTVDGHFDAGIDQNPFEIGRVATATLAGLITQNERGLPEFNRRILVEGKWVDGASLPPVDSKA